MLEEFPRPIAIPKGQGSSFFLFLFFPLARTLMDAATVYSITCDQCQDATFPDANVAFYLYVDSTEICDNGLAQCTLSTRRSHFPSFHAHRHWRCDLRGRGDRVIYLGSTYFVNIPS